MREALAIIRSLSVAYGGSRNPVFALKDVDLSVRAGEKLAVIGESGSGKSTLALALAGLLPPEACASGMIGWPGIVGGMPVAGRDIGMVFQDPGSSLDPVLKIGEQVGEGAARHLGFGKSALRERVFELLTRVHIPEPQSAIHAYPHQFSGGQRQRIAIAAAIAARPKLLIADEPTSALDTVVQAEIVALLEELVRSDSMSLVFITHDLALASSIADQMAVFHRAMLVETGDVHSLLTHPENVYTRQLIAAHVDFSTPRLVGEPI